MNALFLGFLLLAGFNAQPDGGKTDTVVVSAQYSVDVTKIPFVPKFLSGLFGGVAQIFGFAPSRLNYLEKIFPADGRGISDFKIELKDNDGKEWIHAVSDTSEISFAEPPGSKRSILSADGVEFIVGFRKFFRNPDDKSR